MVEKIGGRKAAACLMGLITIVGCFLFKGVIPSELVEAVQYLVTTYLAGNVMSDVVQNVAAVSSKKAEVAALAPADTNIMTPYDDSALVSRLGKLEEAMAMQGNTLQAIVNHLSNPPVNNNTQQQVVR